MKDPRILYFLAGDAPTARDRLASLELGSNVAFRNGMVGTGGAACEKCDGVAGPMIPEQYKKHPDGAELLKKHRAQLIQQLEAEIAAEAEAVKAEDKAAKEAAKAAAAAAKAAAEAQAKGKAPVGNPGAAGAWTAGQ